MLSGHGITAVMHGTGLVSGAAVARVAASVYWELGMRVHYYNVVTECVKEGKLEEKLATAVTVARAMMVGNAYQHLWYAYGEWSKTHRFGTFVVFFKDYDLCEFNASLCALKTVH